MSNLVDDLRATRAVIENEDNWCQGILYREVDGVLQMCLLGAIDSAVAGYDAGTKTMEALADVIGDASKLPADPYNSWIPCTASAIARFNNTQTHAAVLKLIDKAIEANTGSSLPSKTAEIPANLMQF